MADVKITKKPSLKVSSLGVSKSGNTVKASWKYPADAKSGSKNNRFEKVYYQWNVGVSNGKTTKEKVTGKTTTKNLSTTSASINVNPASYYPNSGKGILKYLTFKIWGKNKIDLGPPESKKLTISPPPVPTVSKSVDSENGTVTFTIKSSSKDTAPRKDTLFWVGYKRYIPSRDVKDSDYIWCSGMNGAAKYAMTSAEFSKACDMPFSKGLKENEWIKVICKAQARGMGGKSAASTIPTEEVEDANKKKTHPYKESNACHIWCWPAKPSISSISVTGQIVAVRVNTNKEYHQRVVDKIELERATVDAGSPKPTSGFQSVSGAVDDAESWGLADNFNDALPSEDGKEVWYRVKSTHDDYFIYSEPVKCPELSTTSITADATSISSFDLDLNISPGTVRVISCKFNKTKKNDKFTSNSTVFSCAKLTEPQTYATLDFSSETILTDTAMSIDDSEGEKTISWYIQNLDVGEKYVLRVCRAICSDDVSPSIESRGKWVYFCSTDSNKITAKLNSATSFTVPSTDGILQNNLNADSAIRFTSVGSQLSGTIKASVAWYRGEYNILGNTQKGSDKSVIEYIKKGDLSWQSMELLDENDPDQELDSKGDHEYLFTITGLSDGDRYKLRFKRVLVAGSGSSSIPSSDLSSDYVYYPEKPLEGLDEDGYFPVFDPTSSTSGVDRCGILDVAVDVEKSSMIVDSWFEKTYGTNGTQIMWSTKYPPKALTTGSYSSYDVLDSDLGTDAILSAAELAELAEDTGISDFEEGDVGKFSLIVDDLPKGDRIYLDARRFSKTDSNTSYAINYASGKRYSDQECAWSMLVSAEDDRAYVDSLSSSGDGKTIIITVSHDEDDSDGTEISYSNRIDAWDTTKGPETYSMADAKKGMAETKSISVPDLDPGTRYYFKVRRYMEGSNGTTYGSYSDVSDILTPYPVDRDSVFIDSITSEPDGQGLKLVLGWYEDSSDKTEISYSDYKDAWISSAGTDTFDIVDSDWLLEEPGENEDYTYKATAIIRDLEEGVKYYIRARRIGDDSNGAYTETMEAIPLSAPDSVVLSVPNPIAIGQDFGISWAYQAIANQTEYKLKCTAGIDNVDPVSFDIVMETGSSGSVGISWGDFSSKLDNLLLMENDATIDDITTLSFEVSVTTGGDWVSSSVSTILASPPTLSITLPDVTIVETVKNVVAQPLTFEMTSNMGAVMALARIESQGIMQMIPDGENSQPMGDCIWTEVLNALDWEETVPEVMEETEPGVWEITQPGSGIFETSYTLPTIDFIDNGTYILYVTLYNPTTGLYSEEVPTEFKVAWSHQAVAPSNLSRLDKIGTGPSIAITPIAPVGYAEGDVCDVYRVTQTKAYLIYEGAEFGATIIDDYPPYSMHINTIFDELGDGIDLRYILATRTPDGDIDFLSFPYSLTRNGLMLDWNNGTKHLELPWNVAVSNTYSKDFENRIHMDGTVTGYWNSGSTHTGSFDTVMCTIDCSDEEGATKLSLCQELATYTGPVFVRTSYGDAFCADVTVSISREHNSPTASISLSYTEIDFVSEFAAHYDGDIIEEP